MNLSVKEPTLDPGFNTSSFIWFSDSDSFSFCHDSSPEKNMQAEQLWFVRTHLDIKTWRIAEHMYY